jgi:hypothetical protein
MHFGRENAALAMEHSAIATRNKLEVLHADETRYKKLVRDLYGGGLWSKVSPETNLYFANAFKDRDGIAFAQMGSDLRWVQTVSEASVNFSLSFLLPSIGAGVSKVTAAEAGASSGNWNVIRETFDAPGVVKQFHPLACGSAMAEMLLADRGIFVSQQDFAARIGAMLSSTKHIEFGLGAYQEGWQASQVAKSSFSMLNRGGSWGAMMRVDEGCHWVVVDGLNEAENLLLRDPIGSMIEMSQAEFLKHWTSDAVWGPLP